MTTADENQSSPIDVAIVGGGSAGLALAAELKRCDVARVVVLEREEKAGGIPLHCGHYPFGIREYGRLLKGPEYARHNVATANKLGVEIRNKVSVTKLHPHGRLSLSTPLGIESLQANRVVLCTGVRESSRSQRFISGDRPLGVMSTAALQSLVYLNGMRPFSRPVILGSELVSFSAIETCRHVDIRPVAMVEELDRIIARKPILAYLKLRGIPLYAGVHDPKIIGHKHVEALEFVDADGEPRRIETDGIIVSGRFRPEAALLQGSHLEIDPGSGGPVVDQFGQCSDPTYYSAGNLLRPAESSAWCWREGVDTAKRIVQDLSSTQYEVRGYIQLSSDDPAIRFALPQRLVITNRPGGMTKMQIGLLKPSRGVLRASCEGECISASQINSRPMRRILRPLADIIVADPGAEVQLSLEES